MSEIFVTFADKVGKPIRKGLSEAFRHGDSTDKDRKKIRKIKIIVLMSYFCTSASDSKMLTFD